MVEVEGNLDSEQFETAAKGNDVVELYVTLSADYETPLSAYRKLRGDRSEAFLLESAESSEQIGRFSILGVEPRGVFVSRGGECFYRRRGAGGSDSAGEGVEGEDTLDALAKILAKRVHRTLDLPVFTGGAVGFLGFDTVREFEPSVGAPPEDDRGLPDALYFICDRVVVFDHRHHLVHLIAQVHLDDFSSSGDAFAYGKKTLAEMVESLGTALQARPLQVSSATSDNIDISKLKSNTTRTEYEDMVRVCKEYIMAGDIFQAVPSQRFEVEYSGDPINLYRYLRHINPSPYMFCVETSELSLVGCSPEMHVRCVDGTVDVRPIAGTRPRGETTVADEAYATELLADKKELAEHVMLLDLARNDIGRVAKYGTVEPTDLMGIERFSHVMHIVSNVRGNLKSGMDAFDVMRATFPAGTVSGSPKIRAIQILNSLEKNKRGPYAGAVGYFGYDGNLDSCIALRTCIIKNGIAYIQAGAGIVADSEPASEYIETTNKAAAMLRAVELSKKFE